jgi:hypothetical protein
MNAEISEIVLFDLQCMIPGAILESALFGEYDVVLIATLTNKNSAGIFTLLIPLSTYILVYVLCVFTNIFKVFANKPLSEIKSRT